MTIKINKKLFLRATVLLIFLRSPLVLVSILAYLITSKKAMVTFLAKLLPFIALILVCMAYSFYLGNGQTEVIGQTRDIILTLTVAFFLIATAKDLKNNRAIYNAIKVCFVIVAFAKLLLLGYSIASGQSLVTLIESISKVWNIQMMTLGSDDTALGRIQIPIDSVVPYFLYFYTKEVFENNKSKISLALFLLLCFSMLLTYSRIMWAQSILFIAISIIVEMKLKSKLKLFFGVFILSVIIMYLTPFGDTISAIVSSRFGSDASTNNQASDIVRNMQNNALWAQVQTSPLFGHGIGYYIPEFLRSTDTKYLYESQSLSMLMTLGYIGVAIWLIMIIVFLILLENKNSIPIGSLIFLFFWAVCGSYNPYLFGASGGLILYFSSQFRHLNRMLVEETKLDSGVR